jgi:hypothetical protein
MRRICDNDVTKIASKRKRENEGTPEPEENQTLRSLDPDLISRESCPLRRLLASGVIGMVD